MTAYRRRRRRCRAVYAHFPDTRNARYTAALLRAKGNDWNIKDNRSRRNAT